ncbi:MAG: PilZ domain-containing protein [Gaiellales bacterium]
MIPELLSDQVRLWPPSGAESVAARIAGLDGDVLVLELPAGDPSRPAATPVRVTLDTVEGTIWWNGVLAGPADREAASGRLRVRLLGGPLDVERRQAPRAAVDIPLEIAAAGEPPVAGRLIEVSEDSIKVEAAIRLLAGDLASIVVAVPEAAPLRLTASVVRYAGEHQTALIYELIPREKLDALLRHAFAQALLAAPGGDEAREPGAA